MIYLNHDFRQLSATSSSGVKLVSDQEEQQVLTGLQTSRPADAPVSRPGPHLYWSTWNLPQSRSQFAGTDTERQPAESGCSEPAEVPHRFPTGSAQVLQNFSQTAAVKLLLTSELVNVTRPVRMNVGRLKLRVSEQTDAKKPPQRWKQRRSSEETSQLSQLRPGRKQAANTHLPTPYFSFLVGTQRVMAGGGGGGEGAAIHKYIYNKNPARGRAADPARPRI